MSDHDVEDLGVVADAAEAMAALEAGTTVVDATPERARDDRSRGRRVWAAAGAVSAAVAVTFGLALPVAGGASGEAGRGLALMTAAVAFAALALAVLLVSVAAPVRDGRAILVGLGATASAGFVLCAAASPALRGAGGLEPAAAVALAALTLASGVALAAQARRVGSFVSACSRRGWWLLGLALLPAVAAATICAFATEVGRPSRWPVLCAVALAAVATWATSVWAHREGSRAAFGAAAGAALLLVGTATCAAAATAENLFWCGLVLVAAAVLPPVVGVLLDYARGRRVAVAVDGIMEWAPEADIADHLGEATDTMMRGVRIGTGGDAERTERVIEWALGMARRLDLPPGRMRVISLGALFHDVGKIAVPDEVLNKPGELTELERRLVQQHPMAGFQLATRVSLLWEAAVAIRHHHEWMDGSGYPDGLRGEEIPIESRIIAVCDMYEALTTPRPYRAAMGRDDALMMMRAEVGTHLDPSCFAAFEDVLAGDRAVVRPFPGS